MSAETFSGTFLFLFVIYWCILPNIVMNQIYTVKVTHIHTELRCEEGTEHIIQMKSTFGNLTTKTLVVSFLSTSNPELYKVTCVVCPSATDRSSPPLWRSITRPPSAPHTPSASAAPQWEPAGGSTPSTANHSFPPQIPRPRPPLWLAHCSLTSSRSFRGRRGKKQDGRPTLLPANQTRHRCRLVNTLFSIYMLQLVHTLIKILINLFWFYFSVCSLLIYC